MVFITTGISQTPRFSAPTGEFSLTAENPLEMIAEFVSTVLLALALSLGLNRLMLALAPRLGLMDQPGMRRIHATAIPRAGGIAIWLTVLLVIGGGLASGLLKSHGQLSWEWLRALAAGSAVVMVTGFLDDRRGLPPWAKLGAHVMAPALMFLLYPIRLGLFPADWSWAWDFLVFVGWVVVLINAFNLIDGLDGLCGGLAAISTVALAAMALANGRTDSALLLLVMAAAILGFLKYNITPARMFLGDAGSMLMGFFLATAATDAVGRKAVIGVILLPIAVAGVPMLDVLLAIWRRGMRRFHQQLRGDQIQGGIFAADQDHLHHRLLHANGSQRKVALVLHGISILLTTLAFLPMLFGGRMFAFSLVGFLVVAMVGVRNLAWVEFHHTGSVVHLAIKLPSRHRRRIAAVMMAYDLFVLAAAAGAAVLIETNCFTLDAGPQTMVPFMLVSVTLGSLALMALRIYQRLWVRATMRDLTGLQLGMFLASMATFTLITLVYSSLDWQVFRLAIMSYVFGCAGVCLPRVALDLLREFGMDSRFGNQKPATLGDYGPVVVLGAGDLGTLLLHHLKSSAHDIYPGMRVLGFIDDMRVLHGRRLRSLKILGGLDAVPKLVKEHGLKGIILAIHAPPKELLDQLDALAERFNLKIHHWQVGLLEQSAESRESLPLQVVPLARRAG